MASTGVRDITGMVPEVTAGAAAAQVTVMTAAKRGILVKALSTNAASVFVGNSTVTTSNGIELVAGESLFIALSDPSDLFVVAAGAGDKLRGIVL